MAQPTTIEDVPATHGTNNGFFDDAMEQIRQSLVGLRYGNIQIIVQDGVVIQLERTERKRLRKSDRST